MIDELFQDLACFAKKWCCRMTLNESDWDRCLSECQAISRYYKKDSLCIALLTAMLQYMQRKE